MQRVRFQRQMRFEMLQGEEMNDYIDILKDFAETLFAAVCNACENDGIDECETCDYYIQACKLGITECDYGQDNFDFHFLLRP